MGTVACIVNNIVRLLSLTHSKLFGSDVVWTQDDHTVLSIAVTVFAWTYRYDGDCGANARLSRSRRSFSRKRSRKMHFTVEAECADGALSEGAYSADAQVRRPCRGETGFSGFSSEIEDSVRESGAARPDESEMTPLPGEICSQYVRCGKANCRCNDGKLHGPYHYRVWREGPRVFKQYVKSSDLESTRERCRQYHQQFSKRARRHSRADSLAA